VKAIGANAVGEGARSGLLGRAAWQRVQAAYERHRTPAGAARPLRRDSRLRPKMNDPRGWFITGTDTEIGKTFVACALLHALRRSGVTAVAMKTGRRRF
jgi:hypothetical protein